MQERKFVTLTLTKRLQVLKVLQIVWRYLVPGGAGVLEAHSVALVPGQLA